MSNNARQQLDPADVEWAREYVFGSPGSASRNGEVDAATAWWDDPAPIPAGSPPVKPFSERLLPNTLRPWVCDIAERMQCPPDFSAIATMIGSAALIGRKVGVRPKRKDDWTVVPNLWGVGIGPPGIRKSPAVQEPLKPIQRLERLEGERHVDARRQWQVEREVREIEQDARKKEFHGRLKNEKPSDREKLKRQLLASADAAPPARRRIIVNDSSVEKLGEILRDNPAGVLIYRDELIGLLKRLDCDGQEPARAFYLEGWDGAGHPFVYDRIGRGSVEIPAVVLSIIGCIPPEPFREYLRAATKGLAGGDGLIQRFQLAVWPDVAGEWRNVDRWPDSDARQEAFKVHERLHALTPETAEAERDRADDGTGVPFLRFEEAAQEIFFDWLADLERRVRGQEEHNVLIAHLSKYRSLVPSLALISHLIDVGRGPIGEEAVLRARAWTEYLETHARRMYASAMGEDTAPAFSLARRLERGDLEDGFTARDVLKRDWAKLGEKEGVQRALELLEELNWVRSIPPPPPNTPGRPTRRYAINPRARKCP